MKKVILSSLFLMLSSSIVNAQAPANSNHKATYVIPTVVHMLNSANYSPGQNVLSIAQITSGINNINKQLRGEYAKSRVSTIMPIHRDAIAGLDVELKLVTTRPVGTPVLTADASFNNGIIIYNDPVKLAAGAAVNNTTRTWSDNAGANYTTAGIGSLGWPADRYLNIYIIQQFDAAWQSGVSWRPIEVGQAGYVAGSLVCAWAWSGIADPVVGMAAPFWTTGPNSSGTWVDAPFKFKALGAHEIGHFLNLSHTRGSVNGDSNCNITLTDSNDDRVADTPRHSQNLNNYVANPTGANPLIGCTAFMPVMLDNLMDYSHNSSALTSGQVSRMIDALHVMTPTATNAGRGTLVTNANLVATGIKAATDDVYCYAKGRTAAAGTVTREWINNVTLTQLTGNSVILNNNSVAPTSVTNYYTNYTANAALIPNVAIGQSYKLDVTVNDFWNADNDHSFIVAWIDWNNDGVFASSDNAAINEKYILTNPAPATSQFLTANTATINFTVPAGTAIGNKRIRIRSIWNGDVVRTVNTELSYNQLKYVRATPDTAVGAPGVEMSKAPFSCTPCDEKLYGEVEDYNLNVTAILGLTDFERNSELVNVYPNPATNLINIKFESANEEIENVEIIDLNGKLVKKLFNRLDKVYVDELSSGNYFLKIKGKEKSYIKRFIKN